MTLLNFFKRHLTLARLVVKLQKEAKTYRKQIGGHRAYNTQLKKAVADVLIKMGDNQVIESTVFDALTNEEWDY